MSVVLGGHDLYTAGVLSSLEVVTPHTVCSPLPNTPLPMYGAAAVYNPAFNTIVICGGRDQDKKYLNTCYSLSLYSLTWSSYPAMTTPRSYHTLTLAQDHGQVPGVLVAIGGHHTGLGHATVETFTPGDQQWTARPEWNIPNIQTDHCAFFSSPFLFLADGSYFYKLDLSSNDSRWVKMAEIPESKIDAACGVVDGRLYLVGGYSSSSTLVYDIHSEKWFRYPSLLRERFGAGLGVVGGAITVFGGNIQTEGLIETTVSFEQLQGSG